MKDGHWKERSGEESYNRKVSEIFKQWKNIFKLNSLPSDQHPFPLQIKLFQAEKQFCITYVFH